MSVNKKLNQQRLVSMSTQLDILGSQNVSCIAPCPAVVGGAMPEKAAPAQYNTVKICMIVLQSMYDNISLRLHITPL